MRLSLFAISVTPVVDGGMEQTWVAVALWLEREPLYAAVGHDYTTVVKEAREEWMSAHRSSKFQHALVDQCPIRSRTQKR
jgi:hypothetical protein